MKPAEEKYRNEPARFFGDGVIFKAKLIGILEVGEARGDRMCQEALQDLKVAIRAAGEHKQRITIHVTIEGLRLRDEKTGESLYHHPVHKISFIAQDMTDSRAFGYIFGSPDCGHRFFGIKTDKAASQVVLAMRDLFQCVFELKKKEIELAKQHIQNRITAHEHQQVKNSILDHKKYSSGLVVDSSKSILKIEKSPEASTANLVDLEQELSSIQRGITQMERITPNEDGPTKNVVDDDPFGDSFTSFSSTPFNILPPPASSKRNQQKFNDETNTELSSSIMKKSSTPPIPPFPSSHHDSWFQSSGASSLTVDEAGAASNNFLDEPRNDANFSVPKTELTDAFTDLDPLGKLKPYVDKKFFFQDLKNPPKKVLKDLSEQESIFDAKFSPKRNIGLQSATMSLENNLTASLGETFNSFKTVDPFDEEEFSKINDDHFENVPISPKKSIILPDTKISTVNEEKIKQQEDKKRELYSAPLNVDLPHESWVLESLDPKRFGDRQGTEVTRNVFSVDSFSKKLQKPNLFGQRNVKRDSNGINMRRLQESDSLSENEPELPPRPEIGTHEPPPLPPKNSRDYNVDHHNESKNSFSKTQNIAKENTSRYDYSSKFKSYSTDSPPLPLPSRRINRVDTSFSSISRLTKKSNDEDDYLTPNPNKCGDIPVLLPPPQKKDLTKSRVPRKSDTDPKNLDEQTPPVSVKGFYDVPNTVAPILPDITLSQLLTLGIDDLAYKLNVPAQKLSTMTIMELTKYLLEFIESAKQLTEIEISPNNSPVFKVSFDDSNEATFIAKFDDNFGEAEDNSFVADFEHFNEPPVSVFPTADRYAVFREIIDQEIENHHHYATQHQESIESNNTNSLEEKAGSSFELSKKIERSYSPFVEKQLSQSPNTIPTTKIDTKITEAISGAKDRYAALRDILVEDLFNKSPLPPLASISDSNLSDDPDETAGIGKNISKDNITIYNTTWADTEHVSSENKESFHDDQKGLHTNNKDDFAIDNYMKEAFSELSLVQRLSPSTQNKSSINTYEQKITSSDCLNELPDSLKSMSPLSLAKESNSLTVNSSEEFVTQLSIQNNEKSFADSEKIILKEMQTDYSNIASASSASEKIRDKSITPINFKSTEQEQSWAIFEPEETFKHPKELSSTPTNSKVPSKQLNTGKESPYSSDGKNESKQREKEYHRRWPKAAHTSSSSRDVSPYEDSPHSGDSKRRPKPHHHEAHHSAERYNRTDEYARRHIPSRLKSSKASVYRSKEVLCSENSNWHYPSPSDHWSEEDDTDRKRVFDRNELRNTYGHVYDNKRDSKSLTYERRDYRTHEKRSKYYRTNRNDYEHDTYEVPPPMRTKPLKKDYDDYEDFERAPPPPRNAREYFHDRERKSFDSNESYDSGRGHRLGSGDICGSYEGNRVDYRERERYRSFRRNQRSRDGDTDTEEDAPRRLSNDTGSLQRASSSSQRSKHIQLDDNVWGVGTSEKIWKRPSSASAGDRMSGSGGPSGSDGEKEKKFRRKAKPHKGKEIELRSAHATTRYGQHQRKDLYDYEDETINYLPEENSPRNVSPRAYEPENNSHFTSRRKQGANQSLRSEIKSFNEYSKPVASRYPEDEEYECRLRIQSRGQAFKKSTSRDLYIDEQKELYVKSSNTSSIGFDDDDESIPKRQSKKKEEQSKQLKNSNKFNFDGFDSDDFTSSPRRQEQHKVELRKKFSFESEFSPSMPKTANNQQKLRFNENVSVSKFNADSSSQQMFEDDFLEWTPEATSSLTGNIQSSLKKIPGSNLKSNSAIKSHESITNSDSVDIFSRKNDEDPFENDDFFNDEAKEQALKSSSREEQDFKWGIKNNFANFDDNKNI